MDDEQLSKSEAAMNSVGLDLLFNPGNSRADTRLNTSLLLWYLGAASFGLFSGPPPYSPPDGNFEVSLLVFLGLSPLLWIVARMWWSGEPVTKMWRRCHPVIKAFILLLLASALRSTLVLTMLFPVVQSVLTEVTCAAIETVIVVLNSSGTVLTVLGMILLMRKKLHSNEWSRKKTILILIYGLLALLFLLLGASIFLGGMRGITSRLSR
jgi:hypothetical protein